MIFAAWAVTLLWNIGYAWGRVVLGVSGGCVMYVQLANPDKIVIEKPDRDVRAIEIDVDFEARDAPRHWRVTESSPLIWFPEVDTHEGAWVSVRSYALPLWIPFLFFFILTSYLWLTDRRRYPAGRCAGCGYDLTGNTSGVCSECGTPVGPAGQGTMEIEDDG